jgi:hypothetical protein
MVQRWRVAGWLCLGLSVVLAAVSMVLAFRGDTGLAVGQRIDIVVPSPVLTRASGLLNAVVFGVLAGVAFFSGLTCFFWSAAVEARQQRAEIVRILERWAGQRQATER